jgi:ATP-dependent Clp protease ATP-binding subunit ClpC
MPQLTQVSLTVGAQRLLELAQERAAPHKPDARHLLIAFLHRHALMALQIAPDLDVSALLQSVEEEIATNNPQYAAPLEEVLLLAYKIAQEEGENEIDSIHIGRALLALRGIGAPVEARGNLLSQFGLNLAEMARSGALPHVVGRDEEIAQLMEILCRPINPYAVLVGLEGVGRRAVVHGLAERMVRGEAPEILRNRPVFSVPQIFDHPQFYAGIVEEASKQNAILYIEPFEAFLNAPLPQIEGLRWSFLSELVVRRVPVIGAVSSVERFRRQISRSPDLLKRFQPVLVHPLSAEETLEVLRQLAAKFSEQFALEFPDETLQTIVRVADEHILHRPFPDKAILLLDHAAGRAQTQNLRTVPPQVVWESASLVTGLPIGAGEQSMLERIKGLEAALKSRVIGQDEAIETLVRIFSMKIRRLDLRPERPNGVFLFVGPTGVGKTETARVLAEYFFGSSERMLRLDMNQFYERHTAARLLGAEFGYVGFEMGSPLLDFVAENPFCVVLLDEIEKAHEDIHKLFLQIFDDGAITDAQGRRVSFADAIIIMTSNLHPEEEVGFRRGAPSLEDWRKAFAQQFAPEFINRVDAICIFRPLEKEHIQRIITERFLPRIQKIYADRKIRLEVSSEAIEWLTERGYHERYGARELERTVERELMMLMAPQIPAMLDTLGQVERTVRVGVQAGRLVIEEV